MHRSSGSYFVMTLIHFTDMVAYLASKISRIKAALVQVPLCIWKFQGCQSWPVWTLVRIIEYSLPIKDEHSGLQSLASA